MASVAEKPSILLTPAEVAQLTGAKQPTRQRAVLVSLGVPYRDGPAGLLVSRAAAEDWLRGRSTATTGRPGGPRLDLVR